MEMYFMAAMVLQPGSLIAIGISFALVVVLWMLLLGNASTSVGLKPLALGYGCALLGLLLLSALGITLEYLDAVHRNTQFAEPVWKIFIEETSAVYLAGLVFTLPLLGMVCMPITALMIRFGRFTPRTTAFFLAGLMVAGTALLSATPPNPWAESHPWAMLGVAIFECVLPVVLGLAMPFVAGIYVMTRKKIVPLQ